MIKYIRSLSGYRDIGKIAAYEKSRLNHGLSFSMFRLAVGRAFLFQIKGGIGMNNPAIYCVTGEGIELASSEYCASKYTILPGLCDVHVHFREPGFLYKETIETGCRAAVRGGFTAVCTMPNLNPVPDSAENLRVQLAAIEKSAGIAVLPYGAISIGERGEALSAMDQLAPNVVAFSDDGRGVQDAEMMKRAMREAVRLNKIIAAHCEDNRLLHGGYIHDGEYARLHDHRGICSESEYAPIERDLKLAEEIGCKYHVCHISTKESVDLIRRAKARGVDVSCETAPHYLLLSDMDLQEDGRFKMNPPLRSPADRDALIEGIIDGTIDMIATDHAPHSLEEKSKGLENSAFGVVGLETAFAAMYTGLVRTGKITLQRLIELMSINPRRRFGINSDVGVSVWALDEKYCVDPEEFHSKGRATPFQGMQLFGRCAATYYNGKKVYEDKSI